MPRRKAISSQVNILFSFRLVARMVFAIGPSSNFFHVPDPFIRVPRVVKSTSDIFILAQKGNILEMQKLITDARGSVLILMGTRGDLLCM